MPSGASASTCTRIHAHASSGVERAGFQAARERYALAGFEPQVSGIVPGPDVEMPFAVGGQSGDRRTEPRHGCQPAISGEVVDPEFAGRVIRHVEPLRVAGQRAGPELRRIVGRRQRIEALARRGEAENAGSRRKAVYLLELVVDAHERSAIGGDVQIQRVCERGHLAGVVASGRPSESSRKSFMSSVSRM